MISLTLLPPLLEKTRSEGNKGLLETIHDEFDAARAER